MSDEDATDDEAEGGAMTTPDWRTLPAGRELDALVGERVMCDEPKYYYGASSPCHRRYSTDIAEAWLVVASMRERLFSARHFFVEALRDEVGKRLNFTNKIDHSEVVMYVLPIDICRAALAWAESRKDGAR